ncbi:MAG: cupin domain-containing protein [Mucilaginibacter sp.]
MKKAFNYLLSAVIVASVVACHSPVSVKSASSRSDAKSSSSPQRQRAPTNTMTGEVWVQPYERDTLSHWSVAKVTFEKGAHSNWHSSSDRLVIVAIEGLGYLKEKNKPVQILHKGDVVEISAGTVLWVGATPGTLFSQLVINPKISKGAVNWFEKVSDEEYGNALK